MTANFSDHTLAEKLGLLQRELEALGFALDSRGSREAADVALVTSARIGELREGRGGGKFDENDVRMEPDSPLNVHELL